MTDTVPYYEDFVEIKKKIWSMLNNAVKDRGSPFRIPVFSCGNKDNIESRIVVLRNSDENNNILSLKGKFNLNDSEYQNISIESKFTKKSKKFLIKLSSKENVLMPILNYKNNKQ